MEGCNGFQDACIRWVAVAQRGLEFRRVWGESRWVQGLRVEFVGRGVTLRRRGDLLEHACQI